MQLEKITELFLRNTLILLLETERRPTLFGVPQVFFDERYRERLVGSCGNPLVRDFWLRIVPRMVGDHRFENFVPYVVSKLNRFVLNLLLRPIVGQEESSIDLGTMMDDGRVVLVNLAKGVLGELDAQLLGMMITGKIYNAALARGRQPREARRPFHLYIDEFQSFTTATVALMLAEARKFGLGLTLANQNLAQLDALGEERSLTETVLGNVASLLLIRVGPADAARLADFVRPRLSAARLAELPNHHVVARLVLDDSPLPAFVLETDAEAPVTPGSLADAEVLRARSRERYGRDRDEVERAVVARYLGGRR